MYDVCVCLPVCMYACMYAFVAGMYVAFEDAFGICVRPFLSCIAFLMYVLYKYSTMDSFVFKSMCYTSFCYMCTCMCVCVCVCIYSSQCECICIIPMSVVYSSRSHRICPNIYINMSLVSI